MPTTGNTKLWTFVNATPSDRPNTKELDNRLTGLLINYELQPLISNIDLAYHNYHPLTRR